MTESKEVSHELTENSKTEETGSRFETVALDTAQIRVRCQYDLNLMAALLMPGVVITPYPEYYSVLWRMFLTLEPSQLPEKVFRFALGLPRGHAKTAFLKLLSCGLVLYGRANFILMVCSTEALSHNFLDDVDSMLSMRIVQDVYGNWKSGLLRDTKGLKRGKFGENDVVLAAYGAGNSLRGLNITNRRPDCILMDDVQTKECADSETENKALLSWVTGTLLKCRSHDSSLVIYVGNMYNEQCILHQLRIHPKWKSFITGAILGNWEPLWPAKFTIDQLVDEFMHDNRLGLGDVWFSEVMNIPVGGRLSLLPEGKLPVTSILDSEEPLGRFLIIDPAGDKKTSDDTSLAVHGIYAPAIYQVDHIEASRLNPGECIKAALRLALDWNCSHIFIEDVAYQASLAWHIEAALQDMPALRGITIGTVSPARRAKNLRIRNWVKDVLAGAYSISAAVRDAVLYQALGFRLDRTDNKDDILDTCAYGLDIRAEHHEEIVNRAQEQPADLDGICVVDHNSILD